MDANNRYRESDWEDDVTPPMGIPRGERLILESKIADLRSQVNARFDERDRSLTESRQTFYETRLLPLEYAHTRNVRMIWLGIGLSMAALAVAISATMFAVLMAR